MKKLVVILLALFLATQLSRAQAFTSIQWIVAEPTESFRESAGTGFGAQATYMYFFHPRFALVGSVGYIKWGSRVDSLPKSQYKLVSIPVQFGLRFLLSKDVVAPYLGFSIGMNYLTIRGINPNSNPITYSDRNELKFGFTPHIGIGIRVVKPVGITVDGSYNVIYTAGSPSKFFGLSTGLAIGF